MASLQILLFNCMSVRDPNMLLPHLRNICANYGKFFEHCALVCNTMSLKKQNMCRCSFQEGILCTKHVGVSQGWYSGGFARE